MSMNIDGSDFNVSDYIPRQNSPQQKGKDSSTRHSYAFNQQLHGFGQETSSDSMEIFEGRQLAIVKKEPKDSDYSMNIDEIKVKKEPGLEESPKELLGIRKVQERVKLINQHFDPEKEIGVENCLPCVISFYNWILSGSEYPEPVDPHATPMHEHMFGSNTAANLLNDPFLENLNNPKVVLDVDAEGGTKEYICLTEDLPLTFIPVPLKSLEKTVAKEVENKGVAWHEYEKGGEKFKVGILFLNYRDDESKAHFLAFQYRKLKTPGNKTKSEYNLYVIDPQSSKISEFSKFYKANKDFYTKNIYMWTGQNRINYDCNKTPKQIFEELKKEEGIEKPNQLARIDNVAKSTKLKNKSNKRNNEEDLESEIFKKPKKTYDSGIANNNSNLSKIHSGLEQTIGPVKSAPSHWERLSNLKSAQPEFEDIEDFEGKETSGMDVENKTTPMRKPFGSNPDIMKKGPVNHNGDVDIYANDSEIEIDEVAKEKEIIPRKDASVQAQPLPPLYGQSLSGNKISECIIKTGPRKTGSEWASAIRNAAQKGDVVALVKLGKMHYIGDGVKRDTRLSANFFKKAADKGYPEAQGLIGEMYLTGTGVSVDYGEALKYFEKGEKGKDAFSLHNLATMYLYGIGVEKNYDQYIKYDKLAAEAGNIDSQLRFALVQTDIIEKIKWLKLAANQKNRNANEELGKIYYNGAEGVPVDKQQAFTYFKISADAGMPTSKLHVGLMYLHGIGVTQNVVEAVKYLTPVAHKKVVIAAQSLGLIYYNGMGGVPQDLEKSFVFFKIAAESGDVVSGSYVGRMLVDGKGTQKNYQEAYKWLKLMADTGDADGQAYLGLMHYKGLGRPKNLELAHVLFKSAADKGNSMAQSMLGLMLRDGLGVAKNLQEAAKYLRLGVDAKVLRALYVLADMYLNGEGVPKDFAEYIKYTRMAAEAGQPRSQANLGIAYLTGEGVEKNVAEAVKWFNLSMQQGNTEAFYQSGLLCYKGAEGVPQNMQQARLCFKFAAERGHVGSQAYLARMCLDGLGGPVNISDALKYAKLAIGSDNPVAWGVLGAMYIQGLGCDKNELEGLGYLRRAINLDDALAQATMGAIYLLGDVSGFPKNIPKSLKYFLKAANQGFARAQVMLGKMYWTGTDVEKDLEKAYEYTKLAAAQGDLPALFNLAIFYLQGEWVKKDVTEALKYLKFLAGQLDDLTFSDLSNFELGKIYLYGEEGVPQNLVEAFKCYKSCADSINVIKNSTRYIESQRIIGDMYSKGLGVPQNLALAFEYTKKSAENGDLEAQYNLAHMYYEGLGTDRDIQAAMKYYNLAAGKGHDLAQQALRTIGK